MVCDCVRKVWDTAVFCFLCTHSFLLDFFSLTCRVHCSVWARAVEGVLELSLCSGDTTAQAPQGCCCHTRMHFIFTTLETFFYIQHSFVFSISYPARRLKPFFFDLSFLFLRRDTVSEKSRRRFASLLRSLVLCFSEARHSLRCGRLAQQLWTPSDSTKSQDLYLLFVSLEVLYCSVCSKFRWTCN